MFACLLGIGQMFAQGNENVTIKVRKSKDGQVTVEEDKRSSSDVQDLDAVMRQYGVDAELQGLEPGEEVEIIIRRKKNNDVVNDIVIELDNDARPAKAKKALLGVYYEMDSKGGSLVTRVVDGTSADKYGIQAGDVIASFDGEGLDTMDDLRREVSEHKAGDKVNVVIYRDGKKIKKKVTLGEGDVQPRVKTKTYRFDFDDHKPGERIERIERIENHRSHSKANTPRLGVVLKKVEKVINGETVSKPGLIVMEVVPGTAADQMGLQEGDRLLSMEGVAMGDISGIAQTLKSKKVGDEVEVIFDRNGKEMTKSGNLTPWKEDTHRIERHFDINDEGRFLMQRQGSEDEEIEVIVEMDNEGNEEVREFRMVIIMDDVSPQEAEALSAKSGEDFSGQSSLEMGSFTVGPVPSRGSFKLNFDLPQRGETQIKVLDANGTKVFSEDLGDFTGKYSTDFDISGFAKGVYFLQITQDEKAFTKKIITQ